MSSTIILISHVSELGKAIRNTIKSSLTVPLERVLEAIEQAGVEKEMGFLIAVARNILVKKLGEKIRKMDQTTVAEVKSYSNPPRAAQEVMRASLLLLGHRPSELQVQALLDWYQAQLCTQKIMGINIISNYIPSLIRQSCCIMKPITCVWKHQNNHTCSSIRCPRNW